MRAMRRALYKTDVLLASASRASDQREPDRMRLGIRQAAARAMRLRRERVPLALSRSISGDLRDFVTEQARRMGQLRGDTVCDVSRVD